MDMLIISLTAFVVTCYLLLKVMYRNKPDPKFVKFVEDLRSEIHEMNRYNTEHYLNLAKEVLSKETAINRSELNEKKSLIDQTLQSIHQELSNVQSHVTIFEKDRENKFGALTQQVKTATDVTKQLQETTGKLSLALSGSKSRGNWGERLAEDILKSAGFIKNVNYITQKMIKPQGTIPDYTFFLPNDRKLHMDVKFPFTNYSNYLDAPESEKQNYMKQFLKDVRKRISELSDREFINDDTIDCALMFIPNDQVFSIILENDTSIIDDAIKQKTVMCSPASLFAVLAIIRQSCKWFNLTESAKSIIDTLSKLETTQEEYDKELMDILKITKDLHRKAGHLQITRNNLINLFKEIKNIAA